MIKKYFNKIIMGDCLKIMRTFPENSIDVIVTSTPYFGEYDDVLSAKDYPKQQKEVLKELLRILKPEGSLFYNNRHQRVNGKFCSPESWLQDYDIWQVIVWDTLSSSNWRSERLGTFEMVYWITKNGNPYISIESSKVLSHIWRIKYSANNPHPGPFPQELVERCLLLACPPKGIIFDPYFGSGTTGVVAQKLQKNYIGIERDPFWIDQAQKRLRGELIWQ